MSNQKVGSVEAIERYRMVISEKRGGFGNEGAQRKSKDT